MQAVFVELTSQRSCDLTAVQVADDIGNCFTGGVAMEDLANDLRFVLIHIKPPFGIHFISQSGVAAVGQTLLCIDLHTAMDFLRKLHGIILRHALQNTFNENTRGIVRDIFFCR